MNDKAIIYCRISEDRNSTGAGVERQEAECRALAERNHLEVLEVFIDNDISAFTGQYRPAYRQMLERLKTEPNSTLIAWHTDRITRQLKELDELMSIVEDHDVRILTVQAGDLNLDTSTGRFMARIMGSVAMQESELKADRIRTAHLHNAKKGKAWTSGCRKYGYNENLSEIIEVEAEVIRAFTKKYLSGEGLLSIARWAEKNGHKTVTGNYFDAVLIKRLLKRAYISGRREYQGQIIADGQWKPIISVEESDALRASIANRKQPAPIRRYLLSGLIKCDKCGAKLESFTQYGKRRYRCNKKTVGNKSGCNGNQTVAEPLEELISESVLFRLESENFLSSLNRPSDNLKVTEAQNEISLIAVKSEEILEMFTSGDLSKIEFLDAKRKLEERRMKAEKVLMSEVKVGIFNEDLKATPELRQKWTGLNLDRQRAVINSLVEKVVIKKPPYRTNKFLPERFEIVWKV